MFALTFIGDICVFVGGFVLSIYTWPTIKVWAKGAAAEATSLRDKAAALEAKLRGL